MQDGGDADNVLAMHLRSKIGRMIGPILAFFVALPVGTVINLGLLDVALHFGDANGPVPFCLCSLLKMVPQVTIGSELPIDFVRFAFAQVLRATKD